MKISVLLCEIKSENLADLILLCTLCVASGIVNFSLNLFTLCAWFSVLQIYASTSFDIPVLQLDINRVIMTCVIMDELQ